MSPGFRANAPHLVIGLFIMLIGVALVLDRLNLVAMAQVVQFWPVILILLGLAVMVQAIFGTSDGARRVDVPIGPVILIVFFGLVATHALNRRTAAESAGDDEVAMFALVGGERRLVANRPFAGGEITAIMGDARLDLREADLAPGDRAVIDVFTLMGGTALQVPAAWTVDVQATSLLGAIRDERRTGAEVLPAGGAGSTDEPREPPRLVLRGLVMMGGLTIRP